MAEQFAKANCKRVAVDDLTGHPMNEEIYGPISIDDGFKASIAKGIVQPLTVCRLQRGGYRILCGHRRFAAAVANTMMGVPVAIIDREIDDDQQIQIMVHGNRGRDKNAYIKKREIQTLLPIEEKAAKERMEKGTLALRDANSKAAEKVAEKVGVSTKIVERVQQTDKIKREVDRTAKRKGFSAPDRRMMGDAIETQRNESIGGGLRVAKRIAAKVESSRTLSVRQVVDDRDGDTRMYETTEYMQIKKATSKLEAGQLRAFVRVFKALDGIEFDRDVCRLVRKVLAVGTSRASSTELTKLQNWIVDL